MAYEVTRPLNHCPSHPGALIKDILGDRSETKTAIASMLSVSRMHLYDIMNEKERVTVSLAIKFGKLFGNGPEIWLNMQQAYDLYHTKRMMNVDHIPTLKDA